MALKRTKNGEYVLSSQKQVISALTLMAELQEEISELNEKHGIREMMQDATELKKAADRYMIEKGISSIDLKDGRTAKVVEAAHDRHWILLDSELEDDPIPGAKSLRSILKKKFKGDKEGFKNIMARVSKRVANPEGIQEAVSEGLISENEIQAAFVEKEKKPYMRVYGSRE